MRIIAGLWPLDPQWKFYRWLDTNQGIDKSTDLEKFYRANGSRRSPDNRVNSRLCHLGNACGLRSPPVALSELRICAIS
jgi:hypothetical protein